ncbi:MAG: RloB domain-containing protein [Kiritimatiellae bacterium]|nr:RloB domain-containing protein [Kiritimatiellia bacterium]
MSLTSRRKRPLDRSAPHLRDTRLIVIAVEGEKTERQYFKLFQTEFRSKKLQVKVLHTEGGRSSPRHVFDRLGKFKRDFDLRQDDQLWLMLDVDRWPERTLSEIAAAARSKRFRLAVSNPCFELWLYLHYAGVQPGARLTCPQIRELLRSELGSFDRTSLRLEQYGDKVPQAAVRAKALDVAPTQRWPSQVGTHVYRVVEEILTLLSGPTAASPEPPQGQRARGQS